ncbi:uncharacterized protein PGTG_13462 [Puccinia graminis f. sp. tritici CRL 75-36-700-3]|uniref:DUF833-domain-containing protein n=1 Tax=Puccinia graminis f. sp. tritici (strain CRL 75-36-700-3 / race SCCL) TaxID=418459 RepID=E3KTY1_PUCGT|nr:uncharacterized protein PGTG_13462 [Puccinia graminis f. sp. tritici CRL 75-36-700-3]EFP87676.1 hypothetical protein PGTG_13462 [Puccinia graminis f. sp. tritici CRL 75-36-700-3]
MCIAIWSTKNQLGYKLILAFNRDEFLNRPSLPANWHSFEQVNQQYQAFSSTPPASPTSLSSLPSLSSSSSLSSMSPTESLSEPNNYIASGHQVNQQDKLEQKSDIISGIDVVTGATWLGISKTSGKFAFLTNIESPQTNIVDNREESYNLVIGQIGKTDEEENQFGFFCNQEPDIIDGVDVWNDNDYGRSFMGYSDVHGISNGVAHQAPILPKVSHGICLMEDCLSKLAGEKPDRIDQNEVEMELFNLLTQVSNDSNEDTSSNILIRPHHRLKTPDTPISSQTWCGTKTQTILLASQTPKTRITLVERDAFQIQPTSTPTKDVQPVWMGDDMSRWRRFEFNLTANS